MSEPRAGVRGPWAMFWRQLRRSPLALAGAAMLGVLYAAAAFAPFLAPSSETELDSAHFFHPPQRLHWVRPGGGWSLRPYVFAMSPEAVGQGWRDPGIGGA